MAQNPKIGGGLANLKTIFHDGPNGTLEGQQTQGVDFINNIYANGFSVLQEQGSLSNFEGIEGTTYMNPGILGTLAIQDNIPNIHSTGFIADLKQGDDTLFSGITGQQFINPGNFGFGGALDGHPVDYIDNTDGNGFIENKQHLGPSDFNGIDLSGVPSVYTYTGGQSLGQAEYGGAGTGVDYIDNVHATGFTKLRQHKDPSEFKMVGPEDVFADIPVDVGGTLFNRMDTTGDTFPFGLPEGTNQYLSSPGNVNKASEIDPDNVSLLQRGGIRSVGNSSTLQGSEVTAITLEDMWKDHIDDLIDWENAKGKTDGRLDPRYKAQDFGGGGFLPLTFSRGDEPYIVSPIGENKNIIDVALDDAVRLTKYYLTLDGVKFMAGQNVIGLASYYLTKNKKNGTASDGTADRIGSLEASFGPRQQYQYIYNPLSVFSSSVPYIKVRFNRSLGFDEHTYLDRQDNSNWLLAALDFTDNENQEIATTIPDFDNQTNNKDVTRTTLGGSIQKNVNVSIDGTPVAGQGIVGDRMTRAEIADKETINADKQIFPEGNLESIDNGYPFYFKDLRNDRLLVFRGYIEDMNENITPNWNSETYIGRSEPVYTYANTTRDMSFTLKIHANNYDEYKAIYEKLDYLTGMCYPEYFQDESLGYTRPKPPLARMRLADLYGSSKDSNQFAELRDGVLGFFSSVNYTFEAPWDQFVEGERAPRFITAVIGWTALHDETPNKKTQFYGVGGNYKAEKLAGDVN